MSIKRKSANHLLLGIGLQSLSSYELASLRPFRNGKGGIERLITPQIKNFSSHENLPTQKEEQYMGRRCGLMKKRNMSDEDRLSKLPDEIVHHIFSFLTTKTVLKTSILSSRWHGAWASSSVLHFDRNEFPDASADDFGKCVDQVLDLYQESDMVKKFMLSWHGDFEMLKAIPLVHKAMRLRPHQIWLDIPKKKMPGSFFHSRAKVSFYSSLPV